MGKVILYGVLLVYVYTICKNIVSLIYVNKLFKKSEKIEYEDHYAQLVYLIIPMLNEQTMAKNTYYNFKKIVDEMNNVRVIFVTTSKEIKQKNKKTTYEILKDLIKNESNMFVYNYSENKGVMAHQVNYAIKIISENRNKNQKILIGIYNADSEINTKAIKYVLEKEKKRQKDEAICYQQYSWYRIDRNSRLRSIMSSASLWQTRWSLTFEITRVKQQQLLNRFYKKKNNLKLIKSINELIYMIFEKMNYVIGHGFYMDMDLLQKIGNLPEDTINEDAFLGYIINNENIEIDVIPYLEKADFAPKTSIYVKQQTTWVNGPIYAFQYFKLYLKRRTLNIKEKIRAFVLSIKLFLHFIYWIISPYLLLIILPILLYKYYSITGIIIAIAIILLELPFTHYLVRKVTSFNIQEENNELAKPSFFCIPFFIIHSFGAIRNIFMQMIRKNKMENKYKTERE